MTNKPKTVTKADVIASIVKNNSYMPDSGLILSLTKALHRIAMSELESLELIIGIRETDASNPPSVPPTAETPHEASVDQETEVNTNTSEEGGT